LGFAVSFGAVSWPWAIGSCIRLLLEVVVVPIS